MALDIKTWLLEEGYDEATATELAPKMAANPAAVAKIEASIMRQQDYSREKDKLQAAQTALEKANADLNAQMAEWATVEAQGGEATKKMQRDFEAAQAKVAMLTARVTNIAAQAGLDPKQVLDGLEPVVPPQNTPPPTATSFDEKKFRDELNQQYAGLTALSVTLPGALFNIATEHAQLFGKPLDTEAISREIITRAQTRGNQKSLDPRHVWEELHGVSAKREEVSKAKYEADMKAAEERGFARGRSEELPGQPVPGGSTSPLFSRERKSALQRPQPGGSVSRAASALRAGTYRTPVPAGVK